MKKGRQDSKLIVILEWICGFALGLALITTVWACFVYRDRNGSFLPDKINNSVPISSKAKTLTPSSTSVPNANDLHLDPNATSDTPNPRQVSGEAIKNVSVAGFETLRIAADSTEVSVDFYNPSSNEGEFLMSFELLLCMADGSQESIYSSGLVEAGNHIRKITLSHPIDKGIYENCILRVQPYFASNGNPANTAEVVFTLYAE